MTHPVLKSDTPLMETNANAETNILSVLLDKLASPVAYIGRDFCYKYVNQAYATRFDKHPSEITGKTIIDIVGHEAFHQIRHYMDEVLRGLEVHYEEEIQLKQGIRFIEATYKPDFDENGTVKGYVAFINDITEKKKAETKLKSKQQELQDYLDNDMIGQHWVNKDGIIIWANHAEMNMLGYAESEYIGHHISEFHCDKQKLKTVLSRLAHNEMIQQFEMEMWCKDGSVRPVLLSSNVLWENGEFIHTRCFTLDITPLKRVEQELKVSREHYQNLVQGLPAAVYTTDKDGYITLYNEAAANLWGRNPEIGKEMWCGSLKIFKPDGITPLALDTCPMAIALKEGRIVTGEEIIIERPDGSRKYVLPHPQPLYDISGSITGAVNMLLDITERKIAEESRARLATIVQFSEDAIISKTIDGIITSWNPAAEKLYGFTEEEMIGQPMAILIPEEHLNEEPEILERIRKGEGVDPFETRRIKKGGQLIDVSMSVSPIKDVSGNVTGASNIARDISKHQEVQRLIQENEEHLRLASECAELGTWELNPITNKLMWSEECKKIYGLPLDKEPEYEHIARQNHPEDAEYVNREVAKVMDPANDGNFKIEYRIIRDTDKKLIWLKVQGKMIFDKEKKPQRFIGTMMDVTDERQTLQMVKENEERFRMAVESTKLGTWQYHPLTGKLEWSDECRRIYDVPKDMEVSFAFFEDHIHAEDREYANTSIRKAMDPSGGGNYDIQYRILRYSDKQPRWIRAQGKVYFNDQQPERFIGTVLDITKEKLQQVKLIESVELFQTMADNVPAMIWMSGVDKFNDYFNKTWLEFTGRTEEEESDEGWLAGVHPDDVQKCINTYNTSLRKQQGFYTEYRLRRYDGKYRWIADNSTPRFSPDGAFLGFISACIDIDDQKSFREKIQDSELLFKTISNASPAALWMTDQNRRNVFVSDTWLKWTGRSFHDQINRGWLSAVLEEDREKVINHFFDCFEVRKNFSAEFRVPGPDDRIRWCLTEGKPYFDINGTFAGYAGSVTDITELKKLEQRKDDFIKMASHELKTPITSINGYVQLLLNIYNEAEAEKLQMARGTVKSSLGTIAKQVSKLTRLISELLDLSKIESGKLELHCAEFDLGELIEETVQDIRHTTSRHAVIVDNSFEGSIFGDKDRIGQVLTNILNNAIKYSPDSDRIEVYLEGSKKYVTIRIKDFGIGIDKKDHQKIFERFYRVEGKTEQTYPGFGIGLFIAGEIIHRHKGTIHVKSEKGKGSSFIINLPLDFRK